MRTRFASYLFFLTLAVSGALGQSPTLTLPPTLTASGTTVEIDGQQWGYVVWNVSSPEWFEEHDLAVYLKAGAGGSFVRHGIAAPLTDPDAIKPWITRAAKLGDDVGECGDIAGVLHTQWASGGEAIPAALDDRLSALTGRAAEVPSAAAALRQLGNAHPLYRFVTGTGWAGPLGVAAGQQVTVELRERHAGVEGAVVGRVILTAGSATGFAQPGAPYQVPPDFPLSLPPVGPIFPSEQMDRSIHLRWAVPEALRRDLLLTRGFHVWRLTNGYTPTGGLTGPALMAAESSAPAHVKRLTRNPAAVSKLYHVPGSGESGAPVDDSGDTGTWFVVDDNDRYDPGGTAFAEGENFDYVVAPVDLLGRPGPVSERGAGTAAYTVPPPVPDALRVENIMKNADDQRLRVVWKPNDNSGSAVPTTHYLIYRDRAANSIPSGNDPGPLERITDPDKHGELVYLGAVAHPAGAADELSFDDNAFVPTPGDFGNTYYYSVRAAHLGPFGYNVSAPGPPVFGTLRDREGPPAPAGYIVTDCPRVGVAFENTELHDFKDEIGEVDQRSAGIRLEGYRGLPDGRWGEVEWVQFAFSYIVPGEPFPLFQYAQQPRLYFGNSDRVWTDILIPNAESYASSVTVEVVAGNAAGRVSHRILFDDLSDLEGGHSYLLRARAVSAPTIEMVPPDPSGLPNAEYWVDYFPEAAQSLSYSESVAGTAGASFATPGTRSVLVQRKGIAFGAQWINYATTVSRTAEATIFFRSPGNPLFYFARAWPIVDPDGAPDPFDCPHTARTPGSASTAPVGVVLLLPPGAKEYRLYRRVDAGGLTLIQQGVEKWDDSQVQALMASDDLLPPAGGTLTYYGQALDEHGNPSPLVLLGKRVVALPELPVPALDAIGSSGTPTAAFASLKAVCPSPGVARIEFIIDPPPLTSPGLTPTEKADLNGSLWFNFSPGVAVSEPLPFDLTYLGPTRIGIDPSTPAILERTIRVEPGVEYTISARAIGADGTAGQPSTPQLFTWSPAVLGGRVPWPARPVPGVIGDWGQGVVRAFETKFSQFTPAGQFISSHFVNQYPVAVRIGRIPLNSSNTGAGSNWDVRGIQIKDDVNLGYFALKDAAGFSSSTHPEDLIDQFIAPRIIEGKEFSYPDPEQKLLPVVLYRQQTHREIGGESVLTPGTDIIQASPLIERVAWTPHPADAPTAAAFVDPFVGVAFLEPLGASPHFADLCLFDNSPVAAGATYQYYLVHFSDDGEPDAIIDAGTVRIESPTP